MAFETLLSLIPWAIYKRYKGSQEPAPKTETQKEDAAENKCQQESGFNPTLTSVSQGTLPPTNTTRCRGNSPLEDAQRFLQNPGEFLKRRGAFKLVPTAEEIHEIPGFAVNLISGK